MGNSFETREGGKYIGARVRENWLGIKSGQGSRRDTENTTESL